MSEPTPNPTIKEPVKLLIGINCDVEFCGNCQHHFSSSSDHIIKANEHHWCELLPLDLKEQNGKIPRPPECLAAQQQINTLQEARKQAIKLMTEIETARTKTAETINLLFNDCYPDNYPQPLINLKEPK